MIHQRAGAKSSEFWGMVLCFALVIINGTSFVTVPPEYVTMCFAIAGGYGGARTFLKSKSQTANGGAVPDALADFRERYTPTPPNVRSGGERGRSVYPGDAERRGDIQADPDQPPQDPGFKKW